MKKFVVCAMIMCFSILAYAPAFAQADAAQAKRGMMGMRCVKPWQMFFFFKKLNITAEQKTALKDLAKETDNKTTPYLADMKSLSEQMQNTFLAAEIDTAAAEQQIDDMQALQAQVADIIMHADLQAAQILTADQRALVLDMINKIEQCVDAHRGFGTKKLSYLELLTSQK